MSNATSWASFFNEAFILRLCCIGLIMITRVVNKRLSVRRVINLGSIRIVMKNLSLTIQSLFVSLLPRVILSFNNGRQTFNFQLLLNFMYFSKCLWILSSSLSLFCILDFLFNHTLRSWECRSYALSVECAVTSQLFIDLLPYSPLLFIKVGSCLYINADNCDCIRIVNLIILLISGIDDCSSFVWKLNSV